MLAPALTAATAADDDDLDADDECDGDFRVVADTYFGMMGDVCVLKER